MTFQTPGFWREKNSLPARLLTPLSYLYQMGHRLKQRSVQPYKSCIPVICVGNLSAGGSGKTPLVRALMAMIKESGLARKPCILSRGYGGQSDMVFAAAHHTYKDIGDEPALLAKHFPVAVSKDRAKGAKLIEEHGHDLIVMDDGFQNNGLHKNLNLVVVDGTIGFGNQKLLPAGPMREPLSDGLARTDAVIIINRDTYGLDKVIPPQIPIFTAQIKPASASLKPDVPYIGFCGLGYPEKFKATLKSQNIDLVDFKSYPDHHAYSERDLQDLARMARQRKARLITTEKDAVRLEGHTDIRDLLDVLPIVLIWENEADVLGFLKERILA